MTNPQLAGGKMFWRVTRKRGRAVAGLGTEMVYNRTNMTLWR